MVGLDGTVAGPYAPEDAVFTSSDDAVASFDVEGEPGDFVTEASGPATLTVTWAGQAANGTSGLGVVSSSDIAIEVGANVPAGAALDNGDDFGAIAGGAESAAEVVVVDEFGNQNTRADEITACSVTSNDLAVATATCDVVPGAEEAVNVIVTVTAAGTGTAEISGSVTTISGPLDFGPAPVVVLDPIVTGLSVETGFVGTAVTITGTGLAAEGFATEVLIDGASVSGDVAAPGFVQSVTDTEVVILMPDLGNANDAFEVGVSVGGVEAGDTFTYTQLANAREDEPANDNPATATPITFPLDAVGSYEGIDVDDFHLFTTTGPATIVIDLDWDDHSVDLDILVTDEGVTAFVCFDGATGAAPEVSTCEIPAAGNYQLWLNNYSGPDHPTSYRVKAVVQ